MTTRCGAMLGAWLLAASVMGQQTRYVRADGSDADTGANWDHAWCTISNAVTNAVANDTILVSNGTYFLTEPILVNKAVAISGYPPNTNTIVTKASNGYFRLFILTHSNAVLEYLTITNGNANASIVAWQTGGGGAINMTGGTVRNCRIEKNTFTAWGVGGALQASGNSTISNCAFFGNSLPGGQYGAGIGVYLNGANVKIVDCVFSNNSTTGSGGGVDVSGGLVERCTFYANTAHGGGGGVCARGGLVSGCFIRGGNYAQYGYGGGIYVAGGTVSNCLVQGGTARGGGSGAYIASGLIVECTITSNKPVAWMGYYGAGLYMTGGTVKNALIAENALPDYSSDGGGVYMTGGKLLSCTVASNKNTALTAAGGGTRSGGGIYHSGGGITNCIIFGNTTALIGDDDNLTGTGVVSACWYCCSTGLTNTANANISVDPLFATGGDYRLKSKAGRWTPGGWVTDAQHSPCIDAGPPSWAFAREPAPNGARVNMGYDGNTERASKSSSGRAGIVMQVR